jgi:hypothetical protein
VIRAARLLILAAICLGGCTTRDRSNPLDPRNEQTQGALVGFNAIAADHIVELRWPVLTVRGVSGYRVQRWIPGGQPQGLGTADYNPDAIAAEDSSVANDSTYVYRLIAHLENGDSVVSAPDSATPGRRKIYVLAAGTPSFLRLSPDARDVLYERVASESYVDMELDRKDGLLWLAAEDAGRVIRRTPDGATVGAEIDVGAPGDLSVSSNRGLGWVVSLTSGSVISYGPNVDDPAPQRSINDVPDPRIVEAGTNDPTVWIGNEEGQVYRYRAQDLVLTHTWSLDGNPIRAIALDEATGGAWVATRAATGSLYYLDPADSSATRIRSSVLNAADLAVDSASGDLWMSERGVPDLGAGRLSLITRAGVTLATVTGIEPYGIDIDPVTGSCWVADLRAHRVLEISRTGATLRSSPLLETPYAVRVTVP